MRHTILLVFHEGELATEVYTPSPDSERTLQRKAEELAGVSGKHVRHLRPVPGVKEVGVWTLLQTSVGKQEATHQPLDLWEMGGGGDAITTMRFVPESCVVPMFVSKTSGANVKISL